jgi:hypothetical protein
MPVTDDPQPNYRLPESNILFDSRNDIGDWLSVDFDDSDWLLPLKRELHPLPHGTGWSKGRSRFGKTMGLVIMMMQTLTFL